MRVWTRGLRGMRRARVKAHLAAGWMLAATLCVSSVGAPPPERNVPADRPTLEGHVLPTGGAAAAESERQTLPERHAPSAGTAAAAPRWSVPPGSMSRPVCRGHGLAVSIPDFLEHLSKAGFSPENLVELRLDDWAIQPSPPVQTLHREPAVPALPQPFASLGALTRLSFTNCTLAGDSLAGPFRFPKVTGLAFVGCTFARDTWPTALCFPELAALAFKNCTFAPGSLEDTFDLPKLRFLGMRACGLEDVPPIVLNARQLVRLDLAHNQITQMPDAFVGMHALQNLTLEGNPLNIDSDTASDDEIQRTRQSFNLLGCCHALTELDLSNTGIALPCSIGALANLTHLRLSGTHLVALPETLCFLRALRALEAGGCGLVELPAGIAQLQSLKLLNLRGNPLSDQSNLAPIGNLRGLTILDLGNTHIEALPPSFGNLRMLQALYLDGTRVRALPACVSQLRQLSVGGVPPDAEGGCPREEFEQLMRDVLPLAPQLTSLCVKGMVQAGGPPEPITLNVAHPPKTLLLIQMGHPFRLTVTGDAHHTTQLNLDRTMLQALTLVIPPRCPAESSLFEMLGDLGLEPWAQSMVAPHSPWRDYLAPMGLDLCQVVDKGVARLCLLRAANVRGNDFVRAAPMVLTLEPAKIMAGERPVIRCLHTPMPRALLRAQLARKPGGIVWVPSFEQRQKRKQLCEAQRRQYEHRVARDGKRLAEDEAVGERPAKRERVEEGAAVVASGHVVEETLAVMEFARDTDAEVTP